MVTDLPDYEKKVVVVTIPGDYPAEMQIDHRKILGVILRSPTFPQCIPSSIENDAIAYDAVNDRFKVDIQKISATDVLDISDRAARLLGIVYGNLGQLQQRASTKELLSWINNFPNDYPDSAVLAQLILILAQLDSKTSTLFKAGQSIGNTGFNCNNLPTSIKILDKNGTNLLVVDASGLIGINNLPTDYFKADQNIGTIDDIIKVTITKQLSNTYGAAGNYAAWTPASGKKVRLKFISFESSADVDIGYRFGAAGTIYYLTTTKGRYAANFIGCNDEGAADGVLYFYASAACTIKGFVKGEEV